MSVAIALFGMIISFQALAIGPAALLQPDDQIVKRLLSLSVASGTTPRYQSFPITVAQAEVWANALPNSRAVSELRDELARLREGEGGLGKSGDFVWLHLGATIALEGYGQTNWALPWEYGYAERKPLLSLPTTIGLGRDSAAPSLWMFADFSIAEHHNTVDQIPSTPNVTNLPEQPNNIDFQFPRRSDAVVAARGWSVAAVHDKLRFGSAHTGNLVLDATPDWYDGVRFNLDGDFFNYTWLWLSFDPYLTSVEEQNKDIKLATATTKNMFLHRFDFRFWSFLSFGLNEGTMVGGVAPTLKYLTPLAVFHNIFGWEDVDNMTSASSIFGADVSITPTTCLEFYGQFAMNQIETAYKDQYFGSEVSTMPNALGWLAGVKAAGTFRDWTVDGGFEWVEINPWMYLRENPWISFFSRHRLNNGTPGSTRYYDQSIGYPLGPDCRVIALWVAFTDADRSKIELETDLRIKGENSFSTEYETGSAAVSRTEPSGVATYTGVVRTGLSTLLLGPDRLWKGTAWRGGVDVSFLFVNNMDHVEGAWGQGLQAALWTSFTF